VSSTGSEPVSSGRAAARLIGAATDVGKPVLGTSQWSSVLRRYRLFPMVPPGAGAERAPTAGAAGTLQYSPDGAAVKPARAVGCGKKRTRGGGADPDLVFSESVWCENTDSEETRMQGRVARG
jgi:hypothetical protein